MKNSNQTVSISKSFQIAMEHYQAGRLTEAEDIYKQILQASPNHPDALHFLGIIAHQSENSGIAVELINRAISIKPSAPMYCNLGIVFDAQGNFDGAIDSYHKAISLNPEHAQLYYYLANALKAQGNLDAAVRNYSRALELLPDYSDAYINLGNTFHHLNMLSEAENCYRKALDLPNTGDIPHADVLNGYAMVLFKLGRYGEAAKKIKKALELKPGNQHIIQLYKATLAKLIPLWHFPMLADHDRNAAFRKAIDKHCAEAGLVLEIGTGSGLLAMMAARAGAAKVVTCEEVAVIAENATKIIAANGYGERISVYPVRSTSLTVGRELPERADVLLAEILSSEVLAEGALDSVADAKARLLKNKARIIPASVTVCGALVSSPALSQLTSVGTVEGFDLSMFNEFAPFLIRVPEGTSYEVVSDAFYPFTFLMGERLAAPTTIDFTVRLKKTTTIHGIIQWMRISLDEDNILENAPTKDTKTDHWGVVFHPFPQEIETGADQEIAICCEANGTSIKMRLATT